MSKKCEYCETQTSQHLSGCPFENAVFATEAVLVKQETYTKAFDDAIIFGGSPNEDDPTYLLGWNAGLRYSKFFSLNDDERYRFKVWERKAQEPP